MPLPKCQKSVGLGEPLAPRHATLPPALPTLCTISWHRVCPRAASFLLGHTPAAWSWHAEPTQTPVWTGHASRELRRHQHQVTLPSRPSQKKKRRKRKRASERAREDVLPPHVACAETSWCLRTSKESWDLLYDASLSENTENISS